IAAPSRFPARRPLLRRGGEWGGASPRSAYPPPSTPPLLLASFRLRIRDSLVSPCPCEAQHSGNGASDDSGQQTPDGSCLLTATRLCRLRGSPLTTPSSRPPIPLARLGIPLS